MHIKTNKQIVFVIDDQAPARIILSDIVRGISDAIEVIDFSNPIEALKAAEACLPNLVLTDYLMPQMTGLELIESFRRLDKNSDVPIAMVTSHDEQTADGSGVRIQALKAGATDFLSKPVDRFETEVRCSNLLKRNQLSLDNHAKNEDIRAKNILLEGVISDREKEILSRLAKCGEFRDEETGNHVIRMSRYSRLIAETIGITKDRCNLIEQAAPLHDIGKIGISDDILQKPGKLSESEFRTMRTHTTIGFEILSNSSIDFLQLGSAIALSHHEKYNGKGYPSGLVGYEIPLEARIVAVADVFDALTSTRPYKSPWSLKEAFDYLINERGTHFDPELVDALKSQHDAVKHIYTELMEPGSRAMVS